MSNSCKYPCPCCGYLVFDHPPGSYAGCEICSWEDDASQLRLPDWSGGSNRISLIHAQKNFARFGASKERELSFVRKPLPHEMQEAGWRPVDAKRDFWPGEGHMIRTVDYPEDMTALYYWRPNFWRRCMTGERMNLKLGIAGLGAIGTAVARAIDAGAVPGIHLVAVAARDQAKAQKAVEGFGSMPRRMGLAELAEAADVIVECLPSQHFAAVAGPAIERGRIFMPLSVGALIDHMHLVERARETGARIIVPTGALLGLDAVRAAAEGRITSAKIVTRKPPAGLAGAPMLVARGISVESLKAPLRIFEGSAREAIAGFPANVNVAVALSLAGIGPDATRAEIWADPGVRRNTHTITVQSDSADLTMTIENIPSEENPRTGKITALSAIAALRRLTAPLVVGS